MDLEQKNDRGLLEKACVDLSQDQWTPGELQNCPRAFTKREGPKPLHVRYFTRGKNRHLPPHKTHSLSGAGVISNAT